MRLLMLVTLGLALVVGACSQPAPVAPGKADVAAEEKAIREMDARWLKAAQARDAAGEAALFASDGVAYREHVDPLVGPAAYLAWSTKNNSENPASKTEWSTESIRVSEAGDLAIQTGQYHNSGLGPKGEREDRGRFVTVWKKVNGEWKVAHDIGSTTMPEATADKKP